MEQGRLDEYINALKVKGVNAPCSRCRSNFFDIVGESIVSIQEKPGVVSIGGPSIPVVLVICQQCGNLTMHAQGSLGMKRGGQNG